MKTIARLEPSRHVQGRFLVWLEGESEPLKVTEDEVLHFALSVGRQLEEDEFLALQTAGRRSGARGRAAQLIGARMYSRKELTDKLVEKGETRADARDAADWLEEIGALNDAAYAAALVRHYSARGYGRRRVEQELFRRGIDRDLWPEAQEEAAPASDAVDAFLRGKLHGRAPDEKERKRLSDALLRRGFSWDEVRGGFARLGAELEEDSI